jgi:hypothetical protein
MFPNLSPFTSIDFDGGYAEYMIAPVAFINKSH